MQPSIYLGMQDRGRAAGTDRFVHRFLTGGRVCCFAISECGAYAVQNALQEGMAYTLTLWNKTVTDAIPRPADACGIVEDVSGGTVTITGRTFPCRAVLAIRIQPGGVSVVPCFLSCSIIGRYAEIFDGTVYLRPAPRQYQPPVCGVPGRRTLKNLLLTALMPVGTALYVYGGGWNWQDTGAGHEARQIGLPQSWIDFFDRQDACYTFRSVLPIGGRNPHRYAGLDCSGYLGWTIYNTLHTESGCDGYVTRAADLAHSLARRGYGELHRCEPFSFRPGDIFSMDGHVWLCIGSCRDASIVIAHATPSPSRADCPGGGVQLSALAAGNDSPDCIAYRLARRYMQRFCPRWSARYPVQQLSRSVYTQLSEHSHTGLFRWSDAALPDPDGWREQPAETILQRMSECKKQELDFSLYSH